MTKLANMVTRLVLAVVVWATPGQVQIQIDVQHTVVIQECVAQPKSLTIETDG